MSTAMAYRHQPKDIAKHSPSGVSSSMLLGGACAVLLFAPLAFGSVQSWAIFLLQASATLFLLAWGYRQWTQHELKIQPHPLYGPMMAFTALVAVQWTTGLTAYRHATYSLLLLYAAYGMLAFVVTQSLRRSSQLRALAFALCGYGVLVAFFALLQGIAPNGKLYWIWPLEQGGLIYGPYVNHNHYAGLMEMLTPVPLTLALSRHVNGNRKLAVAAVAALMAGTIFLSGSRGGMIAFAVQIVALAILLRPQRGNWKWPAALALFLVIAIAFLAWIGGNALTQRLAS